MLKALTDRGWELAGIGRGKCPIPGVTWLQGNVTEASLALLEKRTGLPDLVFHAAGSGTVGRTSDHPENSRVDTVESADVALTYLENHHAKSRFVYPSSCAVYGQAARIPTPESAPRSPVSLYGQHKADVEDRCELASNRGIRCSVIRYFSVYGPELRKQLLWEIARKLRADIPQIELAGNGDELRDFIHIDDAIDLAFKAGTDDREGLLLVNGGTGRSVRIADLALRMIRNLSPTTALNFTGAARDGDPTSYAAGMEKADKQLCFRPSWTWERGVDQYCSWFKSNTANESASAGRLIPSKHTT